MIAAAHESIVTCRGLTKEYTQGGSIVQALRGVDLDALAGELTMLVGPSGCGKTTLLSVIAGMLDPTRGEVRVLGEDLHHMTDKARVHFRGQNIGFVFQQYNLLPALTSTENAAIPLVIAGVPRRDALERAAAMLKRMGLGHRLAAQPTRMSGGEQQRVAIARALVHNPRLVVCDEPTSALDGHTGHTIMELLRELAGSRERAVIVVTHDSRVFEFADRIAFMDDGHIVRIESRTKGE